MGLAPLNTPAQHNAKGGRRGKSPQASLCATLPQSPSRITPLRGVVSPPGSPVEESSPSPRRRSSSGLFSWNSKDLSNVVVEDVPHEDAPETPNPPTPALYFLGGVVPDPSVGPDMLSLGLALQQQTSALSKRSTGTEEDVMAIQPRESTRRNTRVWSGRVLLGMGSLLVGGVMALLIQSNAAKMRSAETQLPQPQPQPQQK